MAHRTLVTCALPYANGPVHLGHMVEHVQTDIYVRALRSTGEDVTFLCADDTHGTPIELNARKQGVTPEEFVGRWFAEHQADFADFHVKFDHYSSTNSDENRQFAELIYLRAKEAGFIETRDVEQAYDEKAQRFLPDRFIKGTCPNCGTAEQYGDACEKCGATYGPKELKDPRSVITGEAPVWRKSPHLFFKLSKQLDFLKGVISKPGLHAPGAGHPTGPVLREGPVGLGHQPRRAVLRLRHPRRDEQVLLRLARRPHRLHLDRRAVGQEDRQGQGRARLLGQGCRRAHRPRHRQGHRLLPLPLLAGGARGRAAQAA